MTAVLLPVNAPAPTMSWVRAVLLAFFSTGEEGGAVAVDAALASEIQAAVRGDSDAYARIVRRYQDLVARRMQRFSRDPRQIEELVHDVFVEAYFSLNRYRGDAPLEHWLAKIATRVGYQFWKRKKRDRESAMPLEAAGEVAADVTRDDSSEELAIVLGQLSPRDRLAVTLLYLEERSVAEAAELAGWSQTMLKVQAFRARKKLRALFEKRDGK